LYVGPRPEIKVIDFVCDWQPFLMTGQELRVIIVTSQTVHRVNQLLQTPVERDSQKRHTASIDGII